MAFLYHNKEEALKLKRKYLRMGKIVRIREIEGKVFIDGKKVKYAVDILDKDIF